MFFDKLKDYEEHIVKKAYYEYSEMRKNKEFLRKKFGESKS